MNILLCNILFEIMNYHVRFEICIGNLKGILNILF